MGQEKLASEKVVISSPMSFAGATRRVWKMTDQSNPMVKGLMIVVASIALLVVWVAVVCWYCIFGIFVVPWRLLRRGSRKRKRDELRHREMLATAAVRAEPPKE